MYTWHGLTTSGLVLVTFVVCCSDVVTSSDDVIRVYTRLNRNVTLRCPLNTSSSSSRKQQQQQQVRVRWLDFVHNVNRDAYVIFTSFDNPTHDTEDQHKFHVDRHYSLTISRVSEEDVGNYFCRRDVIDPVDQRTRFELDTTSYVVTAYTVPRCEGVSTLVEGGATTLSCQSTFVGNIDPAQLSWSRLSANGAADGSDVTSTDRFDIRLAARDLQLTSLGYHDDRATYVCRLDVGHIEQCNVTLNVFNAVHDIAIVPIKDVYWPGDEIRCSAAGNPPPVISLSPSSSQEKSGSGWKSLIVPVDWVNTQTQLNCLASNVVAGQDAKMSTKITFNVLQTATTTSASDTVNDEDKSESVQSGQSVVSTGPIVAGIVIGLVTLGAIIVAVVCIRICKDRRHKNKEVQ